MSSLNVLSLMSRSCEVCHRRNDLLRCSGCQVVYYCGKDHQLADRDDHKKACSTTLKARKKMEEEEKKLREKPGDSFTPPDVFENGAGLFWGIVDTRDYMRARYGLVDNLLQKFGTPGGRAVAVKTALDHLIEMMRLSRGDNMGLRDIVPALYIRLGRDQEAYDFIKWHALKWKQKDYEWSNPDNPFLDLKDEDALEAPKDLFIDDFFIHLSHSVAIMLVKVRALLDLQAIQNSSEAFLGSPTGEILNRIRSQLVGNVVKSRPEILESGFIEVERLIEMVKPQVRDLYKCIDNYNSHFWPSMLNDPAAVLANRPGPYSPKTKSEAELMLCYNFAAWAETPGAIDTIRTLSQVM